MMDNVWSWQLFHKINNNEATQKHYENTRDGLIWSFIKFIIIAPTDYCTVYYLFIYLHYMNCSLLKGKLRPQIIYDNFKDIV